MTFLSNLLKFVLWFALWAACVAALGVVSRVMAEIFLLGWNVL